MNDWIVAGINNPDFTVSDFKNIADMSTSNTLMLKKEDYLKSNYIKNNKLFQDDLGKFSKLKFDNFYDAKLREFQDFSTGQFYSGPALDTFSTFRTAKTPIKEHGFDIKLMANPDRQQIGIEGINVWSDPTMSRQEIALSQKIWNSETGKFENYTPDDHSFFSKPLDWLKDLFKDPLVMALYDKDTIDPITGEEHKKGDYKLNANGTYYYETLNGRSPVGKETLSLFDTLTAEGSAVNKYDFFDSDDLNKSVPGVIAKNVVTLAPLFLGGPWATTQAVALIAREMAKSAPLVYDMTTSLFGSESTPEFLNTLAGIGSRFTSGNSLYSKENQLSFENLASMVTDVALQWGQLKTIAQCINKLRGTNKYIEEATRNAHELYLSKIDQFPDRAGNPLLWFESDLGKTALERYMPDAKRLTEEATKLGRDMSLAYMSIISNSDVFQEAVDAGVSRPAAAAIALGSTLGMFAVDKTGLGELMFDDATDDAVKAARGAIKREIFGSKKDNYMGARQAFEAIIDSKKEERFKLVGLIKKAADTAKNAFGKFSDDIKYHSTNLYEKMIGEGVEEVGEEVVTDTAKAIYELAGKLGFDTNVKDIGAWDNAMERYGMSFLGGALGGGVFYGKEVWDGKSFNNDKANEELATLIRNGHTQELYDELEKVRQAGKAGSLDLSASLYEITKDGDEEKKVWLTPTSRADSQNEKIADMVRDKITAINAIINNNRVNLSDDELFKNMVLSEERYNRFLSIAPITNYYEDFNQILNDLIKAESDLRNALKTLNGLPDGPQITGDSGAASLAALNESDKALRIANLKKLEEVLKEKREAKDEFLSGKTSLDYTRKLNFALDPILCDQFLPISFGAVWSEKHKDKDFSEASDEEKKEFIDEYNKMKSTPGFKAKVTEAWEKYKEIELEIGPAILDLNDDGYMKWFPEFLKLLDSPYFDKAKQVAKFINFDSKFSDESDDAYEHRNTKYVDPVSGAEESDADFKLRLDDRQIKVNKYNLDVKRKWVDGIKQELAKVGGKIDPISLNFLKVKVLERTKDVINGYLQAVDKEIRPLYKDFKPDGSNAKEVLDSILDYEKKAYTRKFNEDLIKFNKKELTTADDEIVLLADYLSDFIQYENELRELEEMDPLTIKDILEGFLPDGTNTELTDFALTPESAEIVKNYYSLYGLVYGDDLEADALFDGAIGRLDSKLDPGRNEHLANVKNSNSNIIQLIKADPIVDFNNTVKASLKNPIIELMRALDGKILKQNNITIPKILEILDKIENDFSTIENVLELVLDPQLIDDLYKTKDALLLISSFLHSASVTANSVNPIGHNKMINEFAHNHKNLVENWEDLPELDSDYAKILKQALGGYINTLDMWITISNSNAINKRNQFVTTDAKFQEALFDYISTGNMKFTIDDKECDLLKGFVQTDSDTKLFDAELCIHDNFKKFLEESGLSVEEFLERSGLFDKLNKIATQTSAKLSAHMSASDLTDFDKALYLAQIFSLNPSLFYSKLKKRIEGDDLRAPIATQEYGSKLIAASLNQQFKDIMSFLHKKFGVKEALLANTVFIPGAAGAGKTDVVIRSIKDFVAPEDILVAGPTEELVGTLKTVLGVNEGETIKGILKKVMGEANYNALLDEIKKISLGVSTNVDNDWFKGYAGADGFMKYTLKDDAPLTFDENAPKPKVLVIDEATFLNSLEVLVLDRYMKSIGGSLILAGDPMQNGYKDTTKALASIEPYAVFTARTPALEVSLRDNNIQKQANLVTTRSLLSTILSELVALTSQAFDDNFKKYNNLISKLNFRAYNGDDNIAGDLIVESIPDTTVAKLKNLKSKNDKLTIGFIGSSDSAAYSKIKDLNPKVLSVLEMQGLEFDYVIVDLDFKLDSLPGFRKPQTSTDALVFLKNIYTLMSRGKSATIFIDKGVSDIIGKNVMNRYTATAPNLRDKINGKSAVDDLKEKKLNQIAKYKFQQIDEPETVAGTTSGDDGAPSPMEDFVNPESRSPEASTKLKNDANNDTTADDPYTNLTESEYEVPIFGSAHYLSVNQEDHEEEGSDGQIYKGKQWVIKTDSDELRNLQALYEDGKTAFWYRDKIEMQRQLESVRSFIAYDHSWDELVEGSTTTSALPSIISENFTREDWEAGTFEVEIRESNEVLPIQSNLPSRKDGPDKQGIKIGDKYYIVELVFKVKHKPVNGEEGKICKFDLGGLNDPAVLKSKFDEGIIVANLQKKIDATKTLADGSTVPKYSEEQRKKFLNIIDTISDQITDYTDTFNKWIEQYEEDGEFSLNVSPYITRDKCTRIVDDTEHRLGGSINPNDITEENVKDLRNMYPDMVFSLVYTYAYDKLKDVDPGIKGKAVIFVSSDLSIPSDKLIDVYIKQKQDPDNNYPRVRMVVLENYGMTLKLLYDKDWVETFSKGNGEDAKPFRLNYLGILMYVSLWNWNEALKEFNTAYESWCLKHNYDTPKVNAIISAAEEVRKDANYNLQAVGVTLDDLNNLRLFNLDICKNIPMFKLGQSSKHDFHILQFDSKDNSYYDKANSNFIVLNPEALRKFKGITSHFMDSVVGEKGLKCLLTKEVTETDEKGKKITKLVPWTGYIDPEESLARMALSGLFHSKDRIITITSTDEEGDEHTIAYPYSECWSAIPNLIGKVLHTVDYYQHHTEELNSAERERVKAVLKYKDDAGTSQTKSIQVGLLFEGDNPILKTLDDLTDEEIKRGVEPDTALMDMLDLMFHGTIEDFHQTKGKDENGHDITVQQADLVRFPQGFFIHPNAEVGGKTIEYIDDAIFLPIRTHEGLFRSRAGFRQASYSLSILALKTKKPKKKVIVNNHSPKDHASSLAEGTLVTFDDEKGNELEGVINDKGVLIPFEIGTKVYDKTGISFIVTDYSDTVKSKEIEVKNNSGEIIKLNINDVYGSSTASEQDFDYASIKQKRIDLHPHLTEVLQNLNDDDFDEESNRNQIIQADFKLALSRLRKAIKDSDFDLTLTYIDAGDDLKPVSVKDWFKSEKNIDLVSIEETPTDNIYLINGEKQFDTSKFDIIVDVVDEDAPNRLSAKFGDSTVYDTLVELLQDKEGFLTQLKDELDENENTEIVAQKFQEILADLKHLADEGQDIDEQLQALSSTDYWENHKPDGVSDPWTMLDLLSFIEKLNKDLYTKLFECS